MIDLVGRSITRRQGSQRRKSGKWDQRETHDSLTYVSQNKSKYILQSNHQKNKG